MEKVGEGLVNVVGMNGESKNECGEELEFAELSCVEFVDVRHSPVSVGQSVRQSAVSLIPPVKLAMRVRKYLEYVIHIHTV